MAEYSPESTSKLVDAALEFAGVLQRYHQRQNELLEALHNDALGLETVEWMSSRVRDDAINLKRLRIRMKQMELHKRHK